MTNKKFLMGMLAILLSFEMMVVGCGGGGGGGPQTVKHEGTDSAGSTYSLTITENTERAAYIAVAGDSYVLTIKKAGEPNKVSSGTVSSVGNDGTLTLQPSKAGSASFSVSIADGDISAITGAITLEDGTTVTASDFGEGGNDTGWHKWGDDITAQMDDDGVITVNINAVSNLDTNGISFPYVGQKNKTFKYVLQAWTKSGERNIRVCFGTMQEYEGDIVRYPNVEKTINPTKQTFELECETTDKWIGFILQFHCGGEIGELYVKLISIEPKP